MTTKFKERLIAISRSEKVERIENISISVICILIIISLFTLKPFSLSASCLIAPVVIFAGILDGLRKQKEDVIRKNKLLYVILSDYHSVFTIMLWLEILTYFFVADFIEVNRIFSWIYLIIYLITLIFLPNIISKYFLKKLSKEKPL